MGNIPLLNDILFSFTTAMGVVLPFLKIVWDIFIAWWWLLLPFILWPWAKNQWLFWREEIHNDPQILLEIRIPGEIEKPLRAMESVITGFWPLYGPPNWYDKWWKGKSDGSFSLEVISIEGSPHFLIRCPREQRDFFESHIYAEYPQAEIYEVEDYTKKVPQNIPNNNWDILGTDFWMPGSDYYPIQTYRDFETEKEVSEEKRIDPMSSLIEGMGALKEGEQLWVIIKATPVTDAETGFVKNAEKEINKLVGRKEKPAPFGILTDTLHTMTGFPEKPEISPDESSPDTKLTLGEKEKVLAIERKKIKPLYKCFIRCAYIAKKDNFIGNRFKVPISYINQFNSGLGMIVPWSDTLTKVRRNWYDWFWFVDSRTYVKKRALFRNYLRRVPAFFPAGKKGATFILSSEELATLYHFPSRISVPSSALERVEAKKKQPPANLPIE